MAPDFVRAIAACLAAPGGQPAAVLEPLVNEILYASPAEPSRRQLEALQQRLAAATGGIDRIELVYGGATHIKSYVFEAPKLPEIRGASALLDWINRTKLPELWGASSDVLHDHGIIYASGGHILAFAAPGRGAALAGAIEQIYSAETLTADSVAVWIEVPLLSLRYGRDPLAYWVEDFLADWENPRLHAALAAYYTAPDDLGPDDRSQAAARKRFFHHKTFGELVALLRAMAARRRSEPATYGPPRAQALYPLIPWNARCDSSDVRPAVWRGRIGDEIDPREVSEPSARKRYVGQVAKGSQKTEWFTKSFEFRAPDDVEIDSWEAQWERYLLDNPSTPYAQARAAIRGIVEPAPDVHAIGAASNRYIGMIYADGDRVGRYIDAFRTPREFAEGSRALSDAALEAVFYALSWHLQPYGHFHPFEIITIGGDDLLVIVPANRTFDIALAIARQFETRLGVAEPFTALDRYIGPQTTPDETQYRPRVGLSAGVIIAQETAPIFFLRDLVQELQDSAKQPERAQPGGAVDFMVLKSITMVTNKIGGFRQAAFERRDRRLIARPYTWHELDGLLATIRALKAARVPHSQLYRLRDVLSEQPGVAASSLEYLYTRTRMSQGQNQALLTNVERRWRAAPGTGRADPGPPPWLAHDTARWETIWTDLVEAYEMVE